MTKLVLSETGISFFLAGHSACGFCIPEREWQPEHPAGCDGTKHCEAM